MNPPSFSNLSHFLDTNRKTLLTVLTVLELLILLVVLLRWFDRRYGLRGTGRRIRRAIVGAARDLVTPVVGLLRLRQGVRVVGRHFAGSGPVPAARAGIVSAQSALAERDDFWPYLVLLGPGQISVRLAGPGADVPPPAADSPWQATTPRSWQATRPLPPPHEPVTGGPLPLAVGVRAGALVLLDLARCPGIVSVHGAPTPAERLVSALVVQLAALLDGHGVQRLIVATEPGNGLGATDADRMPLSEALTTLARRPEEPVGRTVLVCRRPDPQTAAQLATLVADDPGLLVLVDGYLPGSRWRLRVNLAGRVIAPELQLDADSAPLARRLRPARRSAPAVAPAPAWAEEVPLRPTALGAVSSVPAEPAEPGRARPAGVASPATLPAAQPRPVPPVANNDLIEQAHDEGRAMVHSGVEPARRTGDR
ncbi:hypothetical protein BDK92_0869 [Micromonospora pisi]|uniref:Uncharacterized protein n=1 Tax=Micromonospora pisi TaxID=589240 RepID=A0A495JC86_9ACTN|nr:hypothetical protein [Micromonospora pisi]RKR86626.1 hypothetical protein BDK92_0869 [Micromonospora pisi]